MISSEEGYKIVSLVLDGTSVLLVVYGIWLLLQAMNEHNKK